MISSIRTTNLTSHIILAINKVGSYSSSIVATSTSRNSNVYSRMKNRVFLDLAVAKSLQSTRMVTDADDDDADVLTTTGYTC